LHPISHHSGTPPRKKSSKQSERDSEAKPNHSAGSESSWTTPHLKPKRWRSAFTPVTNRSPQGDFARTSDGLANSQRILTARFSNVIATLGEKLLPVALTVSTFFLDKVIPTIESLADTFSKDGLLGVLEKVWEWVKEYGPKLGEQFLEWGGALIGWIAENAGPAIDRLGEWLTNVGIWISETGWPYIRDNFGAWATATWDWVTDDVIPTLSGWLDGIVLWISETGWPAIRDNFANWTQATWDWITEDVLPELSGWLDGITGWIDENYTKVEEAFQDLRPALWNWITGAEVDEQTESAATEFANSLGGFLVQAVKTSEAFTDELNKTFLTVIGAGLAKALVAVGILTREDIAKIPMAWTKVKEVIAGWYDAGKEMASILVNGIIDFFTDNAVVSTITDVFKGFYGAVGGALGALASPVVGVIGSSLGDQIGKITGAVDFITADTNYDFPDYLGMLPGMVPQNVTNVNVTGALDPEAVGTQINDLLTQHYQRTGAVPTFL
jgi:hypothetical protein